MMLLVRWCFVQWVLEDPRGGPDAQGPPSHGVNRADDLHLDVEHAGLVAQVDRHHATSVSTLISSLTRTENWRRPKWTEL